MILGLEIFGLQANRAKEFREMVRRFGQGGDGLFGPCRRSYTGGVVDGGVVVGGQ